MSFGMKYILSIFVIILLCFSVIGIGGCIITEKEFKSISFYKSDEFSKTNVQRVLMVPFTFKTQRGKIVEEVTEAFFLELQKSAKFDIVVSYEFQDVLLQQKDLWIKGLIRAETIIEAKKKFNVDAIIFGTITHYKPYEPPILGVKIGMFSAVSGNVIWSSDTVFDSSEASVIQLVKNYYKENIQKKQSLYDWNIVLLSMKRYSQFAAYHIIATL